jgi:toxin ParE1/3/4
VSRRIRWSRRALDDLKAQIAFIAADNPKAARLIAQKIRSSGDMLAKKLTGRPGRVTGTWEKSVAGLPYVLAYTVTAEESEETLVVLRVVHTARDWKMETWPD